MNVPKAKRLVTEHTKQLLQATGEHDKEIGVAMRTVLVFLEHCEEELQRLDEAMTMSVQRMQNLRVEFLEEGDGKHGV